MIKESNIKSYWPQIYNLLKSPPHGINLGNFSSVLPSMDKIIVDVSPNPEAADAYGYVTTEDVNSDGNLDTIHISSPKLNEMLSRIGFDLSKLSNLSSLSSEQLMPLLYAFVEVISHEMGHVNDFSKDSDNPFPGGEAVADSAANNALLQLSVAFKQKKYFKKESAMSLDILKETVKLAELLDQQGEHNYSTRVDFISNKFAQELGRDQRTSQLYHPGGISGDKGKEIYRVRDVDFAWGKYNSSLKNDRYFIMQGMHDLGEVQFPGDPFTYKSKGDDKLVVVSGPESKRFAIGRVIDDPRRKEVGPSAKQSTSSVQDILRELGMASMPNSVDEVDAMYESMLRKFNSDIDKGLRYVDRATGVMKPMGWGVMEKALEHMGNRNLTYEDRLSAWNSFNSFGSNILGAKEYRIANNIFTQAFSSYLKAQKVLELKELMQSSNAEDMESFDELDTVTAKKKEKSFEKGELDQLFWNFGNRRPFGRDR